MRFPLLAGVVVLAAAAGCSNDNTGPGRAVQVPTGLTTVSLDGAVALTWPDNAFQADPSLFKT
jgi:hypothetical protein